MGNNLVRKIESHESHVFETVEVSLPSRHDGLRSLLDQVIHDRQVMRGEVPDHIDVVLEQTQIHPCRVVVVELAERALFYQFTDLFHRPRKQEGVIHHDF